MIAQEVIHQELTGMRMDTKEESMHQNIETGLDTTEHMMIDLDLTIVDLSVVDIQYYTIIVGNRRHKVFQSIIKPI